MTVSCGALAATATAAESTHAFMSLMRAAALLSVATAPASAIISTGGAGRGGGVTSPVNWAEAPGATSKAATMKLRVGMRTTITSRGSSAALERAFSVPTAEALEALKALKALAPSAPQRL